MSDPSSSCSICKEGTIGIHEKASKKAAKTAHEISMKKANKQEVYTFVEVYTILFKLIYEHEYTRNCRIEYERKQFRLRKKANSVCEYHTEFDKKSIKKAESNYTDNKWPNTLDKVNANANANANAN